MAFEPLHGFLIERIWEFLPRYIARRIAPPHKVAREVRIDLRPRVPVEVQFGAAIPYVGMGVRITNLSLVSLKLDRLLYDVWFGQPTVKGQHLEPLQIAARSIEEICLREPLNGEQQQQIRSRAEGQIVQGMTVYVTAYFESKSGPVEAKATLEHRDIVCRGIRQT